MKRERSFTFSEGDTFPADQRCLDRDERGLSSLRLPLKRRNSFPPGGRHPREDSANDVVYSILSGERFRKRKKERAVELQPPVAVYTYGQPRVGNYKFARLFKERVPHTFRVANEGDALTTMPATACCGGRYKHAGLEVMLDEGCTGNTLVGPTIVETRFRFTKIRTNVAAHSMDRYRNSLESALSRDELYEYYQGHGVRDRKNPGSTNLPGWVTEVKRSSLD
uniref:Fungal lipase-type domain-containing protein n=3 Tax=Odontella aurita TaxID=265563 RepID=A0A7S4HRM2_9STRA|mmetsp:Transcript_14056/g.41168  ORF Transcript_14056/g.41168 Transcript_14056/m.41168 type:complete len:223 (+) Transcript_14056:156-824(+)